MANRDDFDDLNQAQRLKAAVHHTVLGICKQHAADKELQLNRMVVATIAEATWKKCEEFSTSLELFAKHAKRSTINADDVKLLVRKSPRLLEHINNEHEQLIAGKPEPKKRGRKVKATSASTSNSTTLASVDMDEDSRQ